MHAHEARGGKQVPEFSEIEDSQLRRVREAGHSQGHEDHRVHRTGDHEEARAGVARGR